MIVCINILLTVCSKQLKDEPEKELILKKGQDSVSVNPGLIVSPKMPTEDKIISSERGKKSICSCAFIQIFILIAADQWSVSTRFDS